MSQLIETIRISNQKIHNLSYHQSRLDISQNSNFNTFQTINLEQILLPKLQSLEKNQTYKCRVIYGDIVEKIELLPYLIRPIQSLKLVFDDTISYNFKWKDRTTINSLFAQRENFDDVLIIKNGLVSDTSYCSILFFDGDTWWTPNTPLLKGTQRAKLLKERTIKEISISEKDIKKYQSFKLVNAMIPFEKAPTLSITHIQ